MIIGILYLALPLRAQETPLTLPVCFEKAIANAVWRDQSALIKTQQDKQLRLTRTGYLPQATVQGQATLQSDVTSVPLTFPGIEIPQPQQDQYKLALEISQPIWDGGWIKAQIRSQELQFQTEINRNEVDQYAVFDQVAASYFGVLTADKQMEALHIIESDLDEKIKRMQAAVANGTAIKSSILALQARRLELLQQQSDAMEKKKSALQILSLLTGEEIGTNATLIAPDLEWTDQENHRPELTWLESQQAVLAAGDDLIKARNRPKINLFGTLGYGRPGLNFLSDQFDWYAIGGIGLKIPVSHWYQNSSSLERQILTIQQEKLGNQRDLFLRNTEIKAAQLRSEIIRLDLALATDRQLLALRREIRDVSSAQLENGVITVSDYLAELSAEDLARQNLALHEIQRAQAICQWNILWGN